MGEPWQFKLPEITFPLAIDTVGICMATGHEITMDCYTCHRHVRLNLVTIAKKHGMDQDCMAQSLKGIVYCKECRARGRRDRDIGFTFHAPTYPHSLWPKELNPPPHVPR